MNYPDVIFFDTNIIRSLTISGTDPKFLELIELSKKVRNPSPKLCLPHIVSLEWLNHHLEVYNKKKEQTLGNIKEIEELIGKQQPNLLIPTDDLDCLYDTYKKKIKNFGFIIVKTPTNISIKQLLVMAAFKVKPFEDKGEKGFRDSIILFTMLEYMKKKSHRNALYLSNDNIFQHDDIRKEILKYGVNITVVKSFPEAITHLNNVVDEAVKQYISYKNKKLLNFVKGNSDLILKFVKENAQITEDFITKDGFLSSSYEILGQVEKVISFEPIEVKSVFSTKGLLEKSDKHPENVEPVMISVMTKLNILYSPVNIFNKPAVSVQELDRFKEITLTTPRQFYSMPIEKEITRTATVNALIIKNKKDEYEELEIQNVSTY